MKYPVAVWFEEGTYTAEVPSLPGVVTEADNLPDLEKAIKEAASGWMEAELDSGRLVPEPDRLLMQIGLRRIRKSMSLPGHRLFSPFFFLFQ